MTIDFKLKTDPDNKEMIYSPNGYQIEMIESTNNELPVITDSIPFIYNQTLALIATINMGQIRESETFGLNPNIKKGMQASDATGQMFKLQLLEELANMATDLFLDNPEVMEYVSSIESAVAIEPLKS